MTPLSKGETFRQLISCNYTYNKIYFPLLIYIDILLLSSVVSSFLIFYMIITHPSCSSRSLRQPAASQPRLVVYATEGESGVTVHPGSVVYGQRTCESTPCVICLVVNQNSALVVRCHFCSGRCDGPFFSLIFFRHVSVALWPARSRHNTTSLLVPQGASTSTLLDEQSTWALLW